MKGTNNSFQKTLCDVVDNNKLKGKAIENLVKNMSMIIL